MSGRSDAGAAGGDRGEGSSAARAGIAGGGLDAATPRRWTTRGAAETERLGAELAAELAPDGLLLLSGDLGAGKTVLARGVAAALGIDPRQVLSPTFNLIREHRGSAGNLVHVDLYRLEPEEAGGLGLDELLAGRGVKVVEWAERLEGLGGPPAGLPALALRLRRLPEAGDEVREIVERSMGTKQRSIARKEESR